MVCDKGRVVLIDEWLKTPSPLAILLFSETGSEIVRYSMSEIATISGVPASTLVAKARVGTWMSDEPVAIYDRELAVLEAGGLRLDLHLRTGRLSLH